MKKVFGTFWVILLCGCMNLGYQHSKYEQRLNKWIGKPSSVLYETWGMPLQTQRIDSETILAIYYQSESEPIDNVFEPYESEMSYAAMTVPNYGLPTPPPLFYCKTTFVIRSGVIVDFNFNGDDCY